MPDFKSILIENFQAASVIRLIRSEIKNPLSVETLEEIREVFTLLESESGNWNYYFHRLRRYLCIRART